MTNKNSNPKRIKHNWLVLMSTCSISARKKSRLIKNQAASGLLRIFYSKDEDIVSCKK